LNDSLEHQKLSVVCELIKGFEIGSQNYIETSIDESMIHYLRVGDLLSLGNTFVKPSSELTLCSDDDILIAFDGAPGRNTIGLEGAYSSGIYKVKCNPNRKGLVYFEINSELNQKIIKDHSQGTTILHASKSIPFLEVAKVDNHTIKKLNVLFEQIINNKKKLKLLTNEKQLLLSKYF
jgi:restriction endonuclease S subunit